MILLRGSPGKPLACLALALLLASCGVKGDPVRPVTFVQN